MENFGFYGELGLFHVLDLQGYDHVLFLMALALPFGWPQWKRVFWLATLFTIAHCLSLFLAAFGWVTVNEGLVEFLIPVTILLTALFNLYLTGPKATLRTHLLATALFGWIHGLGFSNYFRMLMTGETDKSGPLFGFALGIEAAQLLVLVVVLSLSSLITGYMGLDRKRYVRLLSLAIAGVSIWLAVKAWPF